MNNPGWVYIAANPSLPGLVKVGKTSQHPELRLAELNTTGVPEPFVLAGAAEFVNISRAEVEIHAILGNYRHSNNREFFKCEVGAVAGAILSAHGFVGWLKEPESLEAMLKREKMKKRAEIERVRRAEMDRLERKFGTKFSSLEQAEEFQRYMMRDERIMKDLLRPSPPAGFFEKLQGVFFWALVVFIICMLIWGNI